jgi:hypothetical protein
MGEGECNPLLQMGLHMNGDQCVLRGQRRNPPISLAVTAELEEPKKGDSSIL